MTYEQWILEDIPELPVEVAMQLIDALYALTTALENHYFDRIHQPWEPNPPIQYDLFKARPVPLDFDDPLPDF